jgi:arylsulfatase A-like enzyme
MYYHYYEYPQPHHVAPHFGVRTERYKLIRFYGPFDSWELFDLKKDPREMNNVFDSPSMQSTVQALKQELERLILEYGDKEAMAIFKRN